MGPAPTTRWIHETFWHCLGSPQIAALLESGGHWEPTGGGWSLIQRALGLLAFVHFALFAFPPLRMHFPPGSLCHFPSQSFSNRQKAKPFSSSFFTCSRAPPCFGELWIHPGSTKLGMHAPNQEQHRHGRDPCRSLSPHVPSTKRGTASFGWPQAARGHEQHGRACLLMGCNKLLWFQIMLHRKKSFKGDRDLSPYSCLEKYHGLIPIPSIASVPETDTNRQRPYGRDRKFLILAHKEEQ